MVILDYHYLISYPQVEDNIKFLSLEHMKNIDLFLKYVHIFPIFVSEFFLLVEKMESVGLKDIGIVAPTLSTGVASCEGQSCTSCISK